MRKLKILNTSRPAGGKASNGAQSRALAASSRTTALILSGSSTLTSPLIEHGLADEVLLVYPILRGKGKRIFAEGTPPRAFELAASKALPSGIVINAYEAAGPVKNQP